MCVSVSQMIYYHKYVFSLIKYHFRIGKSCCTLYEVIQEDVALNAVPCHVSSAPRCGFGKIERAAILAVSTRRVRDPFILSGEYIRTYISLLLLQYHLHR